MSSIPERNGVLVWLSEYQCQARGDVYRVGGTLVFKLNPKRDYNASGDAAHCVVAIDPAGVLWQDRYGEYLIVPEGQVKMLRDWRQPVCGACGETHYDCAPTFEG